MDPRKSITGPVAPWSRRRYAKSKVLRDLLGSPQVPDPEPPPDPGPAQDRGPLLDRDSESPAHRVATRHAMSTTPLLLIADHRGQGLEDRLGALGLEGFRSRVSTSLRGTLQAIHEEVPALIVLDSLSSEGTEELRALDRARAGDPPVPLLWLTSLDGRTPISGALAAVRHEVWDLADRSAPDEELRLRLGRLLNEARLQVEVSDLRHRAHHDDHTNLLRPRAFQQRLEEHFSAAQRHDLDLALVLIDLDNFGAINKVHDHTVGDILIQQAGEIIRRTIRTEDAAGRIGGDEFAVVLPYTLKVDAARVVGRLVEEIHKLSGRPRGARREIVVSASLGFETFDGRDLDSVETLRLHAERALRVAKERGGNLGVYYRQLDGAERELRPRPAPRPEPGTEAGTEPDPRPGTGTGAG